MIVVTAGHVDHGKSTLVQALTGRSTDRLSVEKERGLSIELGYAYLHFNAGGSREETISFVDVPGHVDYINNMLTGVNQASAALLVVSAVEGIKPQTVEHLHILDLLDIKKGIIALTFADKVSQEKLADIEQQVLTLSASSSLRSAPILPVSATHNLGISSLTAYLKTLRINQLPNFSFQDRYFRFTIDRRFTLKGVGTVITGTVLAGSVTRDSQLVLAKNGKKVRVKSIHQDSDSVERAIQGDRVALAINVNVEEVHRGDYLCKPSLAVPSRVLACRIRLAPNAQIEELQKRGKNCYLHLYVGSRHTLVQARLLSAAHDSYLVQLRSNEDLFVCYGDRVIIRNADMQKTLAGGYVIDPFAPRKKPTAPIHLMTLEALDNSDREALAKLIEISEYGVSIEKFTIARNVHPALVEKHLNSLVRTAPKFEFFNIGSKNSVGIPLPTILSNTFYSRHSANIVKALASDHENMPMRAGLNTVQLMSATNFSGKPALFNAICSQMMTQKALARSGALYHLPEHQPTIDKNAIELLHSIKPHLQEAGFVPPRVFELIDLTKLPQSILEERLRANVHAGKLVQVSRNRFYLPETVRALEAFIEGLIHESGYTGLSVIEFRDKSGIGRNLCIEILEFFDRHGLTRRRGNVRYLRGSL
ncbi:MAG: selenocysteine-specific translation elongation factor [Pseudohongiellaceae bacterium]|nr:selenocysteine-specific translation elongation factor [Pseudohongiellaceae bacterium]